MSLSNRFDKYSGEDLDEEYCWVESEDESADAHLVSETTTSLVEKATAAKSSRGSDPIYLKPGVFGSSTQDLNSERQPSTPYHWPSIDEYETIVARRLEGELASAVESYRRTLEAFDPPNMPVSLVGLTKKGAVEFTETKLSSQKASISSHIGGSPNKELGVARKMSMTTPLSKSPENRVLGSYMDRSETATVTSALPEGFDPEWPNGNLAYIVPADSMETTLKPYFGPAYIQYCNNNNKRKDGVERRGYYFTMTCPLDSVMILRFVPYFAKLHRREVKELQDKIGWLSRSFDLLRKGQLMQARRIWAEEMCGKYPWHEGKPTNMEGNLDNLYERSGRPVHPLHEFQEIHITRKLLCRAKKPCTRETSYKERDHDSDSDVEDTDHESWRPAPKRCRRPVILIGDTLSVEEGLNELLNPKEERKCGLRRFGERDFCAGPSLMISKVTKWPHTLVFDTGSDIRTLAELSLDFTFHDEDDVTNTKKFVLRGAVLVGFEYDGTPTCTVVLVPYGTDLVLS